MSICVSIASYRDPQLEATVRSCIDNATHKDDISFSIVSQADDDEHPDLSFADCFYYKFHYSLSRGVCWARAIANHAISADFILQIDSHTRFNPGWDEYVTGAWGNATQFWGERIILTQYLDEFELDGSKTTYKPNKHKLKTSPYWDDGRVGIGKDWDRVENTVSGDEVFYMAGGCSFAPTSIWDEIPYDRDIYFSGEEMTMALRAYSRGIRLINFGYNFAYSLYTRENRRLHWEDHDTDAHNEAAEKRVKDIYAGKLTGIYGIESKSLHKQFLKNIDMEFLYNI